ACSSLLCKGKEKNFRGDMRNNPQQSAAAVDDKCRLDVMDGGFHPTPLPILEVWEGLYAINCDRKPKNKTTTRRDTHVSPHVAGYCRLIANQGGIPRTPSHPWFKGPVAQHGWLKHKRKNASKNEVMTKKLATYPHETRLT
ncbi:unnamed protein product, partial [Ectocarpus sp. 4 AP-2014]